MNKGEVLETDEKLMADFIKTRTQKVLKEMQQLAADHIETVDEWAVCFNSLAKTFGRDSEEPFRWFKYYRREGLIPDGVALSLLMQIYMDGRVDAGFVNAMVKSLKCEPQPQKEARMTGIREALGDLLSEDGTFTAYRGSYRYPFSNKENESSREIEKAYAFTLDKKTAKDYAVCWYPETAVIYEVRASLEDVVWYSNLNEDRCIFLLPQSKGAAWTVTAEEVIGHEEYGTEKEEINARQVYSYQKRS